MQAFKSSIPALFSRTIAKPSSNSISASFGFGLTKRMATTTSSSALAVKDASCQVDAAPSPSALTSTSKVVLAPMVRSGELPTRLTALHYGADLVWGPETVDKAIIGSTRTYNEATGCVDFIKSTRTIFRTHKAREHGKLIFQMGTANADLAVEAAKVIVEDVAGLDVNAGCPKHFSVHAGMGAGLLSNPNNLTSILGALCRNFGQESTYKLPISVKIRLLSTPPETHALISTLCKTGITTLTLHCRTIPMRPRERAIREALLGAAQICREHNVEFYVNGDIENRKHAEKVIEQYTIKGGAMIAVAAESNPSVFLSVPRPWEEVARHFLTEAMNVENNISNTKFCLTHIVNSKAPESLKIHQAKTYRDMCNILDVECTIPEDKDIGGHKVQRQKQQQDYQEQLRRLEAHKREAKSKYIKNKGPRHQNDAARAAGGDFTRTNKSTSLSERGVIENTNAMPTTTKKASVEKRQQMQV